MTTPAAPAGAYHLVPVAEWEAEPDAPFLPAAYDADGFIHLTHTLADLVVVANSFYRDDPRPYLIVAVALDRLSAPWRHDDDPRFPHLYGPLNRDAVLSVRPAPRQPDGSYLPFDD